MATKEIKDILSLTLPELETDFLTLGMKKFRAGQVYDWLHKKTAADFSVMTNLSDEHKEILSENFSVNRPRIIRKQVSKKDKTIKYLYELTDGERVETVLMPYRDWNTACISTQVGCKMGCVFCASGKSGFVRNLSPGEILSQIYETERDSGLPVGNAVLMGIGEPFDNFENVIRFLKIITDPKGRATGPRHISISTSGIVPRIYELASLRIPVSLSISLHAADDETRSRLMPVNETYNLALLMKACREYFKVTGRRICFEYALISGVNDGEQHVDALANLLKPLGGNAFFINLIPVNTIPGGNFRKSENTKSFHERLLTKKITATIRRTLGSDIEAACGQLRTVNS